MERRREAHHSAGVVEVGAAGVADVHQAIAVGHARRIARHQMPRQLGRILRGQAQSAAPLGGIGERPEEQVHVVGGGGDAARAKA